MSTLSAAVAKAPGEARVAGPVQGFRPKDLLRRSGFRSGRAQLKGRRIAVDVADMSAALAAMIELDGLAARMLLLPPGLSSDIRAQLLARAQIDGIVRSPDLADGDPRLEVFPYDLGALSPAPEPTAGTLTQWAMATSGTSGAPKAALHGLASLTAAIGAAPPAAWGTFYEIRRYGGLQIALRALLGGGPLTLTGPGEATPQYLARLAAAGATHVSGTPSHWRRVLMDDTHAFAPESVRLSGEIVDQGVLNALRARFPRAEIIHAYASTEAGVGFAVDDCLAGFPGDWLGAERVPTLRAQGGALRIKGPGLASAILGLDGPMLDPDGYFDSGDGVEIRDGRCHFLGRVNGTINVGGAKVNPETVEAALALHPDVLACRVTARRNPILGAVVAAEIVARGGAQRGPALKSAILSQAAGRLKPHETPATLTFVDRLDLTAAGKVARLG